MTPDMIMMLSTLSGFSWTAKDYILAFPCEDTDPDKTNGHGVDVRFDYTFYFVVSLSPTPHKIGFYTAEIGRSYFEPYGKLEHRSDSVSLDIALPVLTETPWAPFLSRLQEYALSDDFWSHIRSKCETYLMSNPPSTK